MIAFPDTTALRHLRFFAGFSGLPLISSLLLKKTFLKSQLRHHLQGYRLTFFFCQEQAGPLKQNDWGPNIYPSLVLVQPRKTRPCLTERLLMGRKESNQINKIKLGAQPKIRGPGFGGKINSFRHHCQAFALLIIEVRDPQSLCFSNYLPY